MTDHQSDEANANLALLNAYTKKLGEEATVRMFAFGYSDPENQQTIAKDVGQAVFSGALGLAAPFLVESADFFACPGLVVITESDVLYVRFETVPLEGLNIESLYVTAQQLRYLLESEEERSVKKMALENAKANYDEHRLTIEGDFNCEIRLPVHQEVFRIPGNQTAQAIAYEINGMADLPAPMDLINQIVQGELPSLNEQSQMAGNEAFLQELIEKIPSLAADSRGKVIDVLMTLHPEISRWVDQLISEKSEGALDKTPTGARNQMMIGGLILLGVLARFVWLFLNDDKLEEGSFAASGLMEIGIGSVAFIVFAVGYIAWSENREKLWYRSKKTERTSRADR